MQQYESTMAKDASPEQKKLLTIFRTKFKNNDASGNKFPTDYLDEEKIWQEKIDFVTKRAGLSLTSDNMVDRFIFKNQDYLDSFNINYLVRQGYLGTEDEYEKLLKNVGKEYAFKRESYKDILTAKPKVCDEEIITKGAGQMLPYGEFISPKGNMIPAKLNELEIKSISEVL